MKAKIKPYLVLIGIIAATLLLNNCGTIDPEVPNKAPVCSISTPFNNASFELGTIVLITATASDTDGTITNVVISIDNVTEATLSSAPYSHEWNTTGVTSGQHNIKATTTDNGGLTATSQINVNVTVETPKVTTADITDITVTSAKSGGEVTDDGGVDITARGVVWAAITGPTLGSNDGFTDDGTDPGTFISSLTALTSATTYFVKAYATNSGGTAYGEEKSFMTAGLPTVVTGVVSDITNESAICAAEVTDNGGTAVTARGLVWSLSNNQVTLDDADGTTSEGSGLGSFNSTMTTLVRYTEYWVRAYATNGAGTAYGNALPFRTLPELPAVVTRDISSIEAHLARGGGEITDDGGDPYVTSGLVWGSLPNPTIESNIGYFVNSGYINPFDTLISGIEAETTYYVRAWARNIEETYVYGNEKVFTTGTFSVTTGTFTDPRDNNVYNTLTISGQTWMAENLAYLPEVCGPDSECGYWVYDYVGSDVTLAKAEPNYSTYGVLYNWEMAKAACPVGWHLPSDYEWAYLEVHLGMDITAAITSNGARGTDQGGKMKEAGISNWDSPNTGATNISGFTALPGGLRYNTFQTIRTAANFWTSTQEGAWTNYRYLNFMSEKIGSDWIATSTGNDMLGGSVRCLQD